MTVPWTRAVAVDFKGNSPTQNKVQVKEQKGMADGKIWELKDKIMN